MNPEAPESAFDPRQLRDLFDAACELDGAAREALLDRACAGQPARLFKSSIANLMVLLGLPGGTATASREMLLRLEQRNEAINLGAGGLSAFEGSIDAGHW